MYNPSKDTNYKRVIPFSLSLIITKTPKQNIYNEYVKQHRKRSRFKVQTVDKQNKAVGTWQKSDSHSVGFQDNSYT